MQPAVEVLIMVSNQKIHLVYNQKVILVYVIDLVYNQKAAKDVDEMFWYIAATTLAFSIFWEKLSGVISFAELSQTYFVTTFPFYFCHCPRERCQVENLFLRFPNCYFELFYNQPFMHMGIVEKGLFRIPWDYFNYEWNDVNAFKTIYHRVWSAKGARDATRNAGAKAATKNSKSWHFTQAPQDNFSYLIFNRSPTAK